MPPLVRTNVYCQPKCVLVVDDDDDDTIRNLIAEVLDSAGFQVESAADGQAALVIARSRCPDVIVLDLMMPVMDGWTDARQTAACSTVSTAPH